MHQILQMLMLLLELLIALELLLERLIGNTRLRGDSKALLDRRPRGNLLPPLVQVREVVELHAGEVGHVDPREAGDVRDAVLVADEVLVVFEARVEDAVEALGFANVALRGVGDAFFREAVEVVGLALPIRLLGCVRSSSIHEGEH